MAVPLVMEAVAASAVNVSGNNGSESGSRGNVNGYGSGGEDSGDDPVMVEFLSFCSYKTMLLKEGEMTGTLHIPMLQDPRTGRYRIRTVGK